MRTQACVPLLLLATIVDAGVQHHGRQAVTSDPCESTTALPTVTVTRPGGQGGRGPGGQYEQCYTLTYDKWCSSGLCPGTYTVTQTCDDVVCRHPTETAIPPGFTKAAVECATCGGPEGETLTRTLTFPIDAAPTAQGQNDNDHSPKPKPESSKHDGPAPTAAPVPAPPANGGGEDKAPPAAPAPEPEPEQEDGSHEAAPAPGPDAHNGGEGQEHPAAPQEPENEDEDDVHVVPSQSTGEEHVQAGASSLAARGFGAGALAAALALL